jgi:hypothetical protein
MKKTDDPYETNEKQGTRIPQYAKMYITRDVYGELGWVDNWNVKNSKNNNHRHAGNKEFFDKPANYHTTYTKAPMANTDYFRANAPNHSVAFSRKSSV